MIKFLQIILIFFFLIGCGNNNNRTSGTKELTGDLYYTWLKLGSFYGQPDSVFQAFKEERDIGWYSELYRSDSLGAAYVEMLGDNDLLLSPFIYLRTDQDSIFLVFLEHSDYEQFKKFEYAKLIANEQKVRIQLTAEPIWDKAYLCNSLISVELVDGLTLQKQRKFKIEDYR